MDKKQEPVYRVPEYSDNYNYVFTINRVIPLVILGFLVLGCYTLMMLFDLGSKEKQRAEEHSSIEKCMEYEGYNVYKNSDFLADETMYCYSIFYKNDNAQLEYLEFVSSKAANEFLTDKVNGYKQLYEDAKIKVNKTETKYIISYGNVNYYLEVRGVHVIYGWTLCGATTELEQIINDLNNVIGES